MEVADMRGTEASGQFAGNTEALALALVRTQHILAGAITQLTTSTSAGRQDFVNNVIAWPLDSERIMLIGGFQRIQSYLLRIDPVSQT